MESGRNWKLFLGLGYMLLAVAIAAPQQKKSSSPPPKPAAPVRSAPAVKSAAPAAARPVTPIANGDARTGPSANGPHIPPANFSHVGVPTAQPAGALRPGVPSAGFAHNPPARPLNPAIHGGRPAPAGAHVQSDRFGNAVQRRPNGSISDVHDARRGIDIHHGLNGVQRVSVERADHSRIVVERGRPGYIQRSYVFHGHDFAQRRFYYHGRMSVAYYRGYRFRGLDMPIYAPMRYYPAGFYGWAYYPWGAPVAYNWGFGAAPWAGYYGFYFAPSPVYANASQWLTDYMISNDLAAAYEAGQESAMTVPPAPQMAMGASPEMTPEIKQMIADEVRAQIALENVDAQQNARNQDVDPGSSSIARSVGDGHAHTFLVGAPVDVVDDAGTECALSEGDVLRLTTQPAPDATAASLAVLSAVRGNARCVVGDNVTVAFADLQEMQNHMRESIDKGMEELRTEQGKGGLPTAPPSAAGAPVSTAFADVAPPPDPNEAAAIDQQAATAAQSEKEVAAEVSNPGE
jgi:hypothetical protein